MMPKTIYFHLGAVKTGYTNLQRATWENWAC